MHRAGGGVEEEGDSSAFAVCSALCICTHDFHAWMPLLGLVLLEGTVCQVLLDAALAFLLLQMIVLTFTVAAAVSCNVSIVLSLCRL